MTQSHSSLRKLITLAAALCAVASAYCAPAGTWTARVRAAYLSMADKSDAFTALSINFPSDSVHVNSKFIPEFDISYNFTDHVSSELVLTIPQTQDVTLVGVGPLGSFKHLPPTLLVQYHFAAPDADFQPYVGLGLNFTLIWGSNLKVTTVPLGLESSSFGLGFQAGFDYKIGEKMFVNFDLKKVGIQSDVSAGGARLTTAKLDPWIYSVGLGWRF